MKGLREQHEFELLEIALSRALVELTGLEPVTPSLRKMRSKVSDQGIRHAPAVLWGGCGGEPREAW